jgi:hypothetical protein
LEGQEDTALAPARPPQPARPPVDDDVTVIDVPEELPAKPPRGGKAPKAPRVVREVEVADEIVEEAELDEEEDKPRKPARHFSWLVCAMLFFASLGLGAGAVVPHLDGPTAKATGALDRSPRMKQLKPFVPDEYQWPVTIAPACVAVLAVLGLMIAMGTRNFGFLPLFTTYLAALTTVAGLTLATISALDTKQSFTDMAKDGERLGKYEKVELTTSWGISPNVAFLGGGVALSLFSFSLLLMHRRAFTRLLAALVLLAACGGGAVLILTTAPIPPGISKYWGG